MFFLGLTLINESEQSVRNIYIQAASLELLPFKRAEGLVTTIKTGRSCLQINIVEVFKEIIILHFSFIYDYTFKDVFVTLKKNSYTIQKYKNKTKPYNT